MKESGGVGSPGREPILWAVAGAVAGLVPVVPAAIGLAIYTVPMLGAAAALGFALFTVRLRRGAGAMEIRLWAFLAWAVGTGVVLVVVVAVLYPGGSALPTGSAGVAVWTIGAAIVVCVSAGSASLGLVLAKRLFSRRHE